MLKKILLFCLVIGLIQAHPASKFKKFQDVDRQLQEEEIGASLDRDFVSPHKNDRFNKFFQLYEEEKMGAKAKRTCGYQVSFQRAFNAAFTRKICLTRETRIFSLKTNNFILNQSIFEQFCVILFIEYFRCMIFC